MTPAQPNGSKRNRYYWLRPLLLVSVGLHGLVMLLPMPEKDRAEVPDIEPPVPIQVSELPPRQAPAPISEAANDPVLALTTPQPPPAQPPARLPIAQPPVVQPPVAQPPVVQPPPATTTPAPMPDPVTESQATPVEDPAPVTNPSESGPDNTSDPTPSGPVALTRNSAGLSQKEATDALTEFIENVLPAFPELSVPKFLSGVFLMIYSGEECVPGQSSLDGTTLEGSIAIVVDAQGNVLASRLLEKTGYTEINDWVANIFNPETTGQDRDFIISDLFGWIAEQRETVVEADASTAAYQFKFGVQVLETCTDETVPST
ncbi:MAG: hypothetical protein WBC73_13390 [Phormidesmis sp.]